MIAYILSIVDEVGAGDMVDTRSAVLSHASKHMGIDVKKIIAVQDHADAIAAGIQHICSHADICFVTGGKKSTQNDVTAPEIYRQVNACRVFYMPEVTSDPGPSIARDVGHLLTVGKKTLAIAESCTGGLISHMITDVAGSSGYFLFSAVTYSNEAKMNVLKVTEQTLIDHGAVHEQTAIEMAKGARQVAGADFAISTTGIAGPTGGTMEKPVGRVCIGVAGPDTAVGYTCTLECSERSKNKQMFAIMALELLRRCLVEAGKPA
ncbi:MAG: nicotinamide-nucleotide amidohydrolase family protein [Proteobacteria bacterium]|nr:nicotinamide-nucleotide amidohydrolase family protein [Pseudomonadota bacterium]MBU1389135.1 nicotinamide-nucleotide amidohydrolase family protein [Pseudomonadota bacterium]MBU1543359.1 nicotinamide-nucleotide amidohydrolase family protein [Pseudomonadota bacterium]MBU2429109.1 nicotinamide-nucleotide amidohydrolase family protein [Pseudomonadota bacterium]MBU2481697.1 nicotinamide-nucleotide amidohydrolase family protein [Pseudomonadota bacterium]